MRHLRVLVAVASLAPSLCGAAPITVGGLVRGADGVPLTEVRVELVPLLSNYDHSRTTIAGQATAEPVAATGSDENGRFLIAAPGAGVWTVIARHPGRVPMRYTPLPLVSSTELPPVVLLPDRGTRVAVVDPAGEPRAGVWVYAASVSESVWKDVTVDGWRVGARFGRTDENGRIALPRAADERLEITALPPRSLVTRRTEAGETATLVLPRPTASERVIEVRSGAGEPIPGVAVAAGDLAWPVGVTGEDGRLILTGQPPDPVPIRLFAAAGRRERGELRPDEKVAVLVLAPPSTVAGRVIAAAGRRPLAGALVWPAHDPGTFVLTDPQGAYQFTTPPGERFSVQAEAPGFLPLAHPIRGPGRGPTLTLTAAAEADGRVVTRQGTSISGTVITANATLPGRRNGQVAGRALSDSGGRFTLDRLDPAATYEVRAAREGFAQARVTLGGLDASRRAAPLRIVLEPARPAYGRVVDGQGQPVAEAEVELLASGSRDPEPAAARTAPDGGFHVAAVPGPKVDVRARKPGFGPLLVRGIELPPGSEPVDLGTLVLVPGAAISGRITDRGEQPIAGAEVWTTDGSRRPQRMQTDRLRREQPAAVSEPDGSFRVGDLEPGQRVHLVVAGEGYLPTWVAGIEAPNLEPLRVVLEPASSLRGRVVDEDRQPVSGARVSLHAQSPPPGTVGVAPARGELARTALTDREGSFTLSELPPGKALIEVTADGFQPTDAYEIDVPAGRPSEELVLVLVRGAVVEGRVSTSEGEPVAEVAVNVGAVHATSDGDGLYRLEGVPLGRQTLWARHPEFELRLRTVEIQPEGNVVDFVLRAGFQVTGRVVDGDGAAVAGAGLELQRDGLGEQRSYQATSADDGSFTFSGVVNASYDVEAFKEGYGGTRLRRGLEVAGHPVDGFEVVLSRGASVVGRLVGLEFEDLATARVEAEAADRSLREGTVDYEGGYEIRDLGPGVWQLRARIRGGSREAHASVDLGPDAGRIRQDLEFGTGLTLTGHVAYGGEPLPETSVSLRGHDLAVSRSVTTDHQGNFRLRDLEPGRYQLSVASHREQLLHNEDLELYGDRQVVIEIATARVSGRVTSETTSLPLPDAMIYMQQLLAADGRPGSLTTVGTDSEGAFTLARLSAGHYRLTARKQGYAPNQQRLELQAGIALDGLEVALTPTEGLDAVIRLASGRAPRRATVTVLDPSGRPLLTETHPLARAGSGRFATVPAGTWDLLVSAPGAAMTRATATVPGPPLEVVLAPGARLRIRVPALVESNRIATLTIQGPDGRLFQGLDENGALLHEWPLAGGTAIVEGIPAGTWWLRATTSGGQLLQGAVTTAGDEEHEVVLE